jgi:hypothetical protein
MHSTTVQATLLPLRRTTGFRKRKIRAYVLTKFGIVFKWWKPARARFAVNLLKQALKDCEFPDIEALVKYVLLKSLLGKPAARRIRFNSKIQ